MSKPGTGMGLAVVAGVGECARSKRLGGAVFRIVLPNRVAIRWTGGLVPV
ncbi:MAG: hypothetical protein WEE36_09200 [Acidimicrobiia bacterium]